MKKYMLTIIALISLFMLSPSNVNAEISASSLKETVDEEIELFGGQEGYEDKVNTLKSADLSDYKESDDKVNVYIFRGSTCGYCFDAIVHFASIAKESGKYFNVKTYEVWSNTDNSDLMNDVANEIGDSEVSGVPYIVIGNKSWSGYASSYDEEMMDKIKSEYEKDKADRFDAVKAVNGETTGSNNNFSSKDVITVIIILLAVTGITCGIIFARKKTN